MKYPYLVIHNGVEYPAGTDVPEGNEIPVEELMEEQAEQTETADAPTSKLTRTDINRTPLMELKHLAKVNGIKNTNSKSGAELKKELIEVLGL